MIGFSTMDISEFLQCFFLLGFIDGSKQDFLHIGKKNLLLHQNGAYEQI